jgi:UDP-glucose 4-epimerase
MAAIHYIPHCIKNPEQTKAINVTGTENLVAILLQLSSQPMLVLTSSASVYGASTPVPQRTNYTRRPCDIYGESKMLAEDIVISQYTNYIIARLFNVYGNSDPTPHLIPSITRQLSKSTIELGNPDSARDFIHVEDAARAFLALALRGTTQKVYNIGTGTSYSVRQVTRHIRRASNSKARFVFHKTERRPTDPRTLCADITAIVSDTGWQPSKSFDEGIITTLPSPRLISKSIHS